MSSPSRPSPARELYELLASMRFAISLLTVICIASVVGTVVKQHEPQANYINQFGPFWAELFGKLDLYTVYGAWWFLLILGFLVLSTSLCIARNTPKILADLRSYKEGVREQSLAAHHHKALGELHSNPDMALAEIGRTLSERGWKARVQRREHGIMIAARQGAANKLGYLAAHSAIVLICLGGLFDGDLMVRLAMWAQGKQAYAGSGPVGEQHRLSTATPSFRGTLFVPEGRSASTARIDLAKGLILQDLPFEVELKKFKVEYYPTGMPKSFVSDVLIRDLDSGATRPATVKVNEPVTHRGITIYQSSFEDGGSRLQLRALPLGAGEPSDIEARVGDKRPFGDQTLEIEGLRVINVENLLDSRSDGADVRRVDLGDALGQHLGSGAKTAGAKKLQNIGPSVSYRLRDAAGQAREFSNYMLPVELDGHRVFLIGVRESLSDSLRYLRIPADEKDSLDGWLRLRHALLDPAQREIAAERYAAAVSPADRPQMREQIRLSALNALRVFLGERDAPEAKGELRGGLPSMSADVERKVPPAERERVSQLLLNLLNGSLFELNKLARAEAGLPPPATDAAGQAFMTQAVLALSDSFYYPAPVLLQLRDFEQVQASGFQVARAPGQKLVYLGAVLLALGVFAMLYIRERRLWVWIAPTKDAGGSLVRLALSCTRETPDNAVVFDELRRELLKETP